MLAVRKVIKIFMINPLLMLYIVINDNLFLLKCLATNCYKDSQTLVCNFKVVNLKVPYIFSTL